MRRELVRDVCINTLHSLIYNIHRVKLHRTLVYTYMGTFFIQLRDNIMWECFCDALCFLSMYTYVIYIKCTYTIVKKVI